MLCLSCTHLFKQQCLFLTCIKSFFYKVNNVNGVYFEIFIHITLSQTTNFRLFQTQSLQTTVSNLMKMAAGSPKGSKTLGKGEIACYEQFLLFPLCFQKTRTADT